MQGISGTPPDFYKSVANANVRSPAFSCLLGAILSTPSTIPKRRRSRHIRIVFPLGTQKLQRGSYTAIVQRTKQITKQITIKTTVVARLLKPDNVRHGRQLTIYLVYVDDRSTVTCKYAVRVVRSADLTRAACGRPRRLFTAHTRQHQRTKYQGIYLPCTT